MFVRISILLNSIDSRLYGLGFEDKKRLAVVGFIIGFTKPRNDNSRLLGFRVDGLGFGIDNINFGFYQCCSNINKRTLKKLPNRKQNKI